jgi:hypothetical protein
MYDRADRTVALCISRFLRRVRVKGLYQQQASQREKTQQKRGPVRPVRFRRLALRVHVYLRSF